MEQITKKDLQQLEERLTKLFENKLSTERGDYTEAIKRPRESYKAGNPDLPPFPFWVEILHFAPSGFNIGDIVQIERYVYNQKGDYLKIVGIDKAVKIGTFRVLENYKPTEIEEKKPIWETHPDWVSCRTNRERWTHDIDSGNVCFYGTRNYCEAFTKAHAKRQVAEIKLMEIAEKWNEGVEIEDKYLWLVNSDSNDKIRARYISYHTRTNYNIYFNSCELAGKSIELHKELWMDYFLISE